MDQDTVTTETLTELALESFVWVQAFSDNLMRPWNAYQLAIAAGVFLASYLLALVVKPRMHDWMRSREGWPKWRIRALVVLHRRLQMIFFVVLIWTVVLIMREVTWPSRSYLLAIIANLATAWLFIAFATRLIKNPLVRGVVRYGAWIWVTLSITGLAEDAQTLLESAAFNIGESRLSLWLLIQAIILLAALLTFAFPVVQGRNRLFGGFDKTEEYQIII